MNTYATSFFERLREGVQRSARTVAPLLYEWVQPQTIIDIGCGDGTWLAAFQELGVDDVWGVDGDYIETGQLAIPAERFIPHDLETPLILDRTFDLVLSLEVAEHLAEASADGFVDTLVELGPVVLFSAAIPSQGGTHHVNEQWPSYWSERFQARGYRAIDAIRHRIWSHDEVDWWYAQNTILYVQTHRLNQWPILKVLAKTAPSVPPALVHPKNYLRSIWKQQALQALHHLRDFTPSEATVLLVDDDTFGIDKPSRPTILPFPERNGEYAGLPSDSASAIRELERLQNEGADFIVFAWPSFWWLEHYRALHDYLRSHFRCVLENETLIAFDLR